MQEATVWVVLVKVMRPRVVIVLLINIIININIIDMIHMDLNINVVINIIMNVPQHHGRCPGWYTIAAQSGTTCDG